VGRVRETGNSFSRTALRDALLGFETRVQLRGGEASERREGEALVRAVHLGDAAPVAREVFGAAPDDPAFLPFLNACTEPDRLPSLTILRNGRPMGLLMMCCPPFPSTYMSEWISRTNATADEAFTKVYDEGWRGGGEAAAEAWSLTVGRNYRRMGVGTALLGAACRFAASCGLEALYASATADNEPGARFLSSAGCLPLTGDPLGGRIHFKKSLRES
jgi:ribosomal protein S18 acetylase RimI-like enzyme